MRYSCSCDKHSGAGPLNFLWITFDFPPTVGGIQTRAKNYIKNLTKMKNKVIVVHLLNPRVLQRYFGALAHGNETCVDKYLGATVYRYPSSVKNVFQVFFKTIKFLKNTRIDVIHIISGANTPAGLLFLIYGKIKGMKTGVSCYGKDILSSRHNPLDILLLRSSMFLADRIGANSKATSRLVPKTFRHKVTFLYPGVDVQALRKFENWRGVDKKEKLVLFVGRLVWRKSVHDLLQAFKRVLEKVPEAKLVVVGDGPQREALINLTQKLGIQDKVEFTGTLVGEELWKKYQECDVFVMPSKETRMDMEGFGVVFLEAGLFGKPSIGTWSGGISEAVIQGETGILIPQGDIVDLKNAIELLLTNEDLARRLGQNAYNRVISEFTWEKATLRFLKMYQQ